MPILISNNQYKETIDIISGEKKLSPIFNSLQEWYFKNAGFKIYNFIIEEKQLFSKNNEDGAKLLYLSDGVLSIKDNQFIVSTLFSASDLDNDMLYNLHMEAFNYFLELCSAYNQYLDINWKSNSITGYDFNRIWWRETISKFSQVAIPKIKSKYKNANIHSIINSELGRITVFFQKDTDLVNCRRNGICSDITELVDSLFNNSGVDERLLNYDYGTNKVDFSSRETLERNFGGDLFTFYK